MRANILFSLTVAQLLPLTVASAQPHPRTNPEPEGVSTHRAASPANELPGVPLPVAHPIPAAQETELIRKAALRWLVRKANQHPSGELGTACLVSPDRMGWPALEPPLAPAGVEDLKEFLERDLGILGKTESGCDLRSGEVQDSSLDLYFDKEKGTPAALVVLGAPELLEPTRARIRISYLLGKRWGEDHRCDIQRGDNGWAVASCSLIGIY